MSIIDTASVLGKRNFSTLAIDENERPFKKKKHNVEGSVNNVDFNKIVGGSPINHFQNPQTLQREVYSIDVESSEEEQSEEDPEWIRALDKARDGNLDELVKLVKNGLLKGCEKEDLEEIFDIGLINNNRELVFECVKRGLSKKNRNDALRFAVETNDIELSEALLNGVNEQTPINFSKWSNNNPLVGISAYKEKHEDQADGAIIELLCSKGSVSKHALEEYEWRKCLANIWNIRGNFTLNGIKSEYEGAFIHFFRDNILSSIRSFKFEFPEKINDDLLDILEKLIDGSRTTIDIENKISTFNNYQPIMIHGGMSGHHLEVILWRSLNQSYLLICNKGLLSEVPVQVYSIDPTLVNAELIKNIQTGQIQYTNNEEAKEFYTSILPNLLKGIPHKVLTDTLKQNWMDESLLQTGENCVWESVHTAMFGAAGIQAWIKNGCEENANSNIREKTILKAFKQVKQWSNYVGLWSLGEYLNNSRKDRSNLDVKLVEDILNKAELLINKKSLNEEQYDQICNKARQAILGSFH